MAGSSTAVGCSSGFWRRATPLPLWACVGGRSAAPASGLRASGLSPRPAGLAARASAGAPPPPSPLPPRGRRSASAAAASRAASARFAPQRAQKRRVAGVQLAAAGARPADARLAEHGLAARRAERVLEPVQLRVERGQPLELLLEHLAAVLLAAAGLVDEAAEVAQRELARAAQEARAAAEPAAAGGHPAALGVLGRDARGQALPVLAGGGAFGGGSAGRIGERGGRLRPVSSAAPGRLMRRRRPLMNVRNVRDVPSERV